MPVNTAGLLLILLSGVLFIAEANTASFGLLAFGGVAALALGSLMLIFVMAVIVVDITKGLMIAVSTCRYW